MFHSPTDAAVSLGTKNLYLEKILPKPKRKVWQRVEWEELGMSHRNKRGKSVCMQKKITDLLRQG